MSRGEPTILRLTRGRSNTLEQSIASPNRCRRHDSMLQGERGKLHIYRILDDARIAGAEFNNQWLEK